MNKCLIKGCGSQGVRRGLCLMCYSNAKKKVESGVTTWDKMAEAGLCEKSGNPFDNAFNDLMSGENMMPPGEPKEAQG